MKTLLLDRDAWDLCLDASGNIAVASEPYAQVQDVASACRLFRGEAYYDVTRGIPYFSQILGRFQPIQVVKEYMARSAKRVPGVTSANVYLSSMRDRIARGQIQIMTDAGTQVVTL